MFLARPRPPKLLARPRPPGRRRTVVFGTVLAATLAGIAALPGPASAAPRREPIDRILVLSLPGLTAAEVREHDLPAIEDLLEQSAVADLATRGVASQESAGGAYLTISSGSRATSDPVVDGQQLALGDQSAGSAAGDIFHRRTGNRPTGEYVSLAWPQIDRANARQPYDAELGKLAETLDESGVGVAAIGNADGSDTVGQSFERQVGLGVISPEGEVAAGELGTDILLDDPASPFGKRLDPDQVVHRFEEAWQSPGGQDRGLVMVEGSDLARTIRYRDRVDATRYAQMREEALKATDALVSRLLEQVDPDHDAVMLLAPYGSAGSRDLTLIGLQSPDRPSGYLGSASTQRKGFVTLVDIGPSLLEQFGITRPVGMEGRSVEFFGSGHSLESRLDTLVSYNAASRFREQLLFPTTLVVVLALGLVCTATALIVARDSGDRPRRLARLGSLTILSMMPASYLARIFPLEDWGTSFYWPFLLGVAICIALLATLAATRLGRTRLALVAVLGVMVTVLVLDVMTGSNLSLSAAFGYSPTGNSRLYGISNYSFGQVAGASCLLAAMLAAREGARARWEALALLVAMLVVIGVPKWGSDVGGILAFTPTILVFAGLVWRRRLRIRHVLIAAAVTLVAVTAFGFLDLARPPEQRAHLGRLFERIGDEGAGPLWDIMSRKALANLGVSTSSFWVAAIPVAILFLLFLTRYPSRPIDYARQRMPLLNAGLAAAVTAAVLGSLVNDSGAIVGGVTLLVVTASLVYIVLEPERAPASNSAKPASPNSTAAVLSG